MARGRSKKQRRLVDGEQYSYSVLPCFRYSIGQDVLLTEGNYQGRIAVVADRYFNAYDAIPIYVLVFRGECFYIEMQEAQLDPIEPMVRARCM